MRRRSVLAVPGAVIASIAVHPLSEARATTQAMQAAIATFTGGAPARAGRVEIDVSPLVENGNAVPVTVTVASPMTDADHVSAIALFTARNPQPEVAVFRLGPHNGRARVATRMRLATSQAVTAVARLSDGSHWLASVEVEVTLAACVES